MEIHVSDTWKAMCHNAWQRHACVTHGMPCVNMHGSFEAYIRDSHGLLVEARESSRSFRGSSKEKRKGGKEKEEERRREREERKGGREETKGERKEEKRRRKGRKRGKRKREEEGVLRSEMTWTAKNPELRYKR